MKFSVAVSTIALLTWCSTGRSEDVATAAPDGLFKRLDVNGNGKLVASEIPQEHRKFFERLLRIGDADKNGELSREEFDAAMKQKDEPVTDLSKIGGVGGAAPARGKRPDPQRVFTMLDKNKNGKLTRDEVENRPFFKSLFDRLGKDELTLEDLSALPKNAAKAGEGKKAKAKVVAAATPGERPNPFGGGKMAAPTFFRLLDTDHDGKLSKEELSKATALFDQFDRNQDGFLDSAELFGSPAGAPEMPAARPMKRLKKPGLGAAARKAGFQQMVERIMASDQDGDGKLSKDEAPPKLQEHFSRFDKNHDGFLDRGEVESAVKRAHKNGNALSGPINPAP